jgi:hypothetical protein
MDFKNEFIIELMECILSGADELQVKHMLDKETQNLQLQQTGVMACFSEEQLNQINKYGKHQYNRGLMDLNYVSFEFWLK